MSEWAYVAIAYGIAWGGIALYALLLARRVAQAKDVAEHLSEVPAEETDLACDVPPAP